MMPRLLPATAAAVVMALSLQACAPAVRWEEPAPARPTATKPTASGQQRSSRGNPPFYEVYGKRYYVLDTSHDYRERGVASWYGKKFHGRSTSSGEIYDMHKMTAAHKTLPLPTEVRVTHLGNGKSIVVTVNDRGPFVHNRIIDLSFAAAQELDMIGSGTALVQVETLSGPGTAAVPLMTELEPTAPTAATQRPVADARLYLQVGAFGDPVNARDMRRQLEARGLSNVVIRYDLATSPTLYRVRLGPIADVAEYDALVELMASMHVAETHLVTEAGETGMLDLATTTPAPVSGGASPGVSAPGSNVLSGG